MFTNGPSARLRVALRTILRRTFLHAEEHHGLKFAFGGLTGTRGERKQPTTQLDISHVFTRKTRRPSVRVSSERVEVKGIFRIPEPRFHDSR